MKRLIIFAVLFTACNSVKQVLKDPAKVEKIGREWEKQHPCNNDTTIITKRDTTIVLDTLYNILTDTVIVDGKPTIIIKKVPEVIVKKVTITDTVNNYVVDNRRLNIALDSVNWYKGTTQQFKAKFEQQISETKAERARGNKWVLYFILLCVLLAVSHWLRSKFL